MRLSRKKINDMVDRDYSFSSSRSGGGSGVGGGGGVSSQWVDDHYVSKEFFARLFTINGTDENDDDVVVEPNDLETTITNIQMMVGAWTESYLSALGLNPQGGGGGATTLASLTDVTITNPVSGQTLVYDGNGHWVNSNGGGSVVGVSLTMPTGFTANSSTSSGVVTLTASFNRGSLANGLFLATPISGNGNPEWRAIDAADIPALDAAKITTGTFDTARIPDLSATYATVSSVYTKTQADAKFMTIEAFERLFNALDSSKNKVNHPYSSGVASIKALFGVWTNSYISALGQNSQGGGGGGGTGDVTWTALANASDTRQISISHLTTALQGYASSSRVGTLEGYFTGGIANNAARLSTVIKTAWGQTYWTANGVPDNVTGTITVGDGDILLNNTKKLKWKNSVDTELGMITLDSSNNFILGESNANSGYTTYLRGRSITFQTGTGSSGNHTATLSDAGTLTVEKLVIGSITISHNTQQGGLHIEGAGLYADTFISALGANSQGGGGTGDVTWTALANTSDNRQIAYSHLSTVLSGYVQSGTLGDYALAADTVFAVKVNGTTYYPGQYGIADLGNIGGTYELPLAADGTRGGIQIGFTTSASNRNYAVLLSSERAYVKVPWTDENVKIEKGDPDTVTQYFPTFYTSVPSSATNGTLNTNIGLKYFTAKSSGNRVAILELGNYNSSSSSLKKDGKLRFCNASNDYTGTLVTDALTASRTYKLPNNDGTIALTTDIPSSANFIPTSGSSAITGSLTPSNTNSVNLGSSSKKWKNIYGISISATDVDATGYLYTGGLSHDSVWLFATTYGYIDSHLSVGGKNTGYNLYVNGTSLFSNTVGIGGYNASYKLYVSGTACMTKLQVQGTTSPKEFIINWNADGYYEIGTTNSTNTEIDIAGKWYGSWQGPSDIRLKNVIDNVNVGIEKIADIPIFNFTWKDGRDKDLHLGTSAQYIQGIFPNAVSVMKAGTLGMDYGAAALAAAKLTARKVVDHEERIKRLEKLYLNKD